MDSKGLKGAGQLSWQQEGGLLWLNGFFGDSLVIGTRRLAAEGDTDAFLLSFSEEGQLQKSYSWGQSGNTRARTLLSKTNDRLILGGVTDGAIKLSDTILSAQIPGDYDLFVFEFNPESESTSWSFGGGGVLDEEVSDMDWYGEDELIIGGYFSGLLDFANGLSLQSTSTQPDAYIIRVNEEGSILDGFSFGSPGNVRIFDLTTTQDTLLATGSFTESLAYDDRIIQATGIQSGFIIEWQGVSFDLQDLSGIRSDNTVFLEAIFSNSNYTLAGGLFSGVLESGQSSTDGTLDPILLQRDQTTALIPDPSEFFQLSISPNPTNGLFRLINKVTCDSFILMDLQGRVIQKGDIAFEKEWDLSSEADGTYLLHLRCEEIWRSLRILKN